MELFGILRDGAEVQKVTLQKNGLMAGIITRGATLQKLQLEHQPHSLVLGFEELEHYVNNPGYFGATVGRVANRIANGRAPVGSDLINLDKNENGTQILHGGSDGSGVRNWRIRDYGNDFVILEDQLPHLHMGFPGKMNVTLTYEITDNQGLKVEIAAVSDRDTLCNFAHHSYFNLDGSDNILDHQLQIDADCFLPIDQNLIPTGECKPVENTPFDFRIMRPITWMDAAYNYDHNFCLSNQKAGLRSVARLKGPATDLVMSILTTEPGLQVYDGSTIVSVNPGFNQTPYNSYSGIALEPQFWPDAPNHDTFPNIDLNAGEQYHQTTLFEFA